MFASKLHERFELEPGQIAFYREKGYVKVPGLLDPGVLAGFRGEIVAQVAALQREAPPLHERSTYDKAFLQLTNLWRRSPVVRELVFSRRLARVAAELMGCRGARLWHDQALFKEPGGGMTPWHADQYYWPLSSDRTVTAWIPLVDVPLEMGPLAFCPGSQSFHFGRDLAISEDSEQTLKERLAQFGVDESAFRVGDVSFHSGWTFHRAGANRTGSMREVFTIIYMDQDIRLAAPRNKNQEADRAAWCPDVRVGEIIDSPLTPVIYGR